ncbi:MAG: hypothetical protein JXA03_16835 [Bacteroidales bacterium]|nr:hypothetical protein [Bacteroidales bacterium]
MKTLTKNLLLGVFTILIIFSFNSCTKRNDFLPSTMTPAAAGYVKVKKDKNNNYVIKIRISNLAAVESLQQSKNTYVVWMETDKKTNENLGQVKSSNNLNVTFETVSSSKPVKIFITAEEDGSKEFPGNVVVLSTAGIEV